MPAEPIRIVVLEGDQTGQELLEASLRVLDPAVLGLEVELERFDLSLANRRATRNDVCSAAAARMRETGLGLKGATSSPEGAEDASRAVYDATLEAAGDGIRTHDLGGEAGTVEVCREVASRVGARLS